MKQLFKKGWFQVIFFGVLIGGALIIADAQFNWFGHEKNNPRKFNGTVVANADDIYFTQAEYSSFIYNFGHVAEGDTVVHTFKIKNTGREPLYIFKVNGSCDCLAAFYSGDPITPGQEEDIRVHFNTKGRKGRQERKISVMTNTEPSEAVLTFMGVVE